ncbi:MAG TPA: NAD(P)-dependent oxidoreductase [Acidimicrobiales bacterium]|nr:NAD(P)-dependent oxidoreductase [Acidimicrobiales bacterium]
MRVLVTGARGRIGRHVVDQLVARGDEVVAIDRAPLGEQAVPEGVTAHQVDLLEIERTRSLSAGCDALVHLAAIPSPRQDVAEEVFRVNVVSTFNVLQAFTDAGGGRAVLASSLSALGMSWGPRVFSPLYAPVDEEHPLFPADAYGLSKEVTERTGEMFHRRAGTTVVMLRFPGVFDAVRRAERIAALRRDPGTEVDVRELWAYIYHDDVASAFVLGVHADISGCEVVNVGAADTLCEVATVELLRRYHPTTEIRAAIEGTAPVWSIEKARRLLGFTPRHSWRRESQAT